MSLANRGWKHFFISYGFIITSLFFWSHIALAEDSPARKYTHEELLSRMLVVNAAERSLDSLPALAVTFSQDLSPIETFDKFLTVTHKGKLVAGGWIIAGDPRRLYFTHIKPNASYRVQVRPGVKSASGLVLQESGDFTVKTRDIKPAFDFATRGSILPARLNNGLPIRVVNVPELDIEFLRVKPEQLKAVLGHLFLEGSIKGWQLDHIHEVSDSIYSQRYVTQTRQNARENRVLPIESIPALQEPGLYFAVMREPGRFGNEGYRITHFIVTNIGLHVRRYTQSMEVFVRALDTGAALADVQLQLQGQKETLTQQSDADGIATFSSLPKGSLLLKANQGQEFAFLDLRGQALDLSEYPITGEPDKALAAYIYSPRNLYRPGEAVDLSILLRNRDGQVEPLKKLHLKIIRPDAKTLQESILTTQYADLGYFSHRVQVPADVPTGTWRAEIRLGQQDNTPLQSFSFYVEDFIPERMALNLKSTTEPLRRGEKMIVQVQGDYLYGAPAAGNLLSVSRTLTLNRSPVNSLKRYVFGNPKDASHLKRTELPKLTLDEKGQATLQSDALSDTVKSPVTVRIIANLKETGGARRHTDNR